MIHNTNWQLLRLQLISRNNLKEHTNFTSNEGVSAPLYYGQHHSIVQSTLQYAQNGSLKWKKENNYKREQKQLRQALLSLLTVVNRLFARNSWRRYTCRSDILMYIVSNCPFRFLRPVPGVTIMHKIKCQIQTEPNSSNGSIFKWINRLPLSRPPC